MLQFVLYLGADDRASIFIIQTFELGCNFLVETCNVFQVVGIVGAHFDGACKQPVGQSAVAYLAMTEWTDAYQDLHTMFLAELHESPHVTVVTPIEDAFTFFMDIPENVGGDDGQTAGLHFQDGFFPLLTWITAIVEFTHDRNSGDTVL